MPDTNPNQTPAQNKKIYPSLTSFEDTSAPVSSPAPAPSKQAAPSAQPQAAKQETPKTASPEIKPAISEQKPSYLQAKPASYEQKPAYAPQKPAYTPQQSAYAAPKPDVQKPSYAASKPDAPKPSYQSNQPNQAAGWQKQVSYEQKPSAPVSKPDAQNPKPSTYSSGSRPMVSSYEQKPSYQPNSQSQSSWKSQVGSASNSNQAQPAYQSNSRSSWKSQAGSSSSNDKRGAPFRLYKATKANSGSAFSLDLNAEKQSIFIDVSKQIGEQKFDWEHKITMKLSITDIGKMLSVLTGSTKSAKLYHDPSKGQYESSKDTRNTVLEFSKGISFGYSLKASEQGTNGSVQSVLVPISEDEGEVVRVLLEAAIRRIYGW
ncbi:MAG TPA: hypothetical protein PLO51_02620 [Candidatus Micrarchaeota archaeon]|nr:hypothetical protein [Candidatus Micrarchaeota archaeon]